LWRGKRSDAAATVQSLFSEATVFIRPSKFINANNDLHYREKVLVVVLLCYQRAASAVLALSHYNNNRNSLLFIGSGVLMVAVVSISFFIDGAKTPIKLKNGYYYRLELPSGDHALPIGMTCCGVVTHKQCMCCWPDYYFCDLLYDFGKLVLGSGR